MLGNGCAGSDMKATHIGRRRIAVCRGVLVLVVALQACGGHFEVPVPVLAAPAAAPPPNEPATIVLPVRISLAKVRAGLDTLFPPVDSLDRARCTALGGLVCHQYLYRRDSLDLRMQ